MFLLLEKLLPVLTRLFADPVGLQKPVAPLTTEELESGGRIAGADDGMTIVSDPHFPGANVGDVHTSAGYALLKFDVGLGKCNQQSNINNQTSISEC